MSNWKNNTAEKLEVDYGSTPDLEVTEGFATGSERLLLLAMLFDAVQVYINNSNLNSKSQKQVYLEAKKWIEAPPVDYSFSFQNVCQAVGIDPHYLRMKLTKAANQSDQIRRRRRDTK